jgi:hypothetical protein
MKNQIKNPKETRAYGRSITYLKVPNQQLLWQQNLIKAKTEQK